YCSCANAPRWVWLLSASDGPPDVQVLSALLLVGLAASHRSAHGARLAGTTLRLVLDSSVQPQLGSSSASIANTSLSPWTYRESCVESRLPRQIFHAVCLTSGCLSPHGGGEDASLEAKPIYHQVLVLHKTLRQRAGKRRRTRYGFRLGTEVIAVGCTCVRPSVVTHGTNHTGPS
uniref:Interleukin 17a/f1 n=2 Tax=Gasterosteus aculeatus aculeatus TaxID=481459 RepID=A0AAQ4RVE0_GASAC